MSTRHLKTLTVPVSWPIKRKGQKFVARPLPGKTFSTGMPVVLIFKDLLKYCKTSSEVKTLLRDKEIFIDGKRVKDIKTLVGLMDIFSIPLSNENYRLLINKNKKLQLVDITTEEVGTKPCRIIRKTVLKKGKVQLNLFDGRNILVKEDNYAIGDTLLIKVPEQKVVETMKLEKGNYAMLTNGAHTGEHGVIEKISEELVTIKTKESSFETPKPYVFVIGKTKSAIKLLD